MKYVIFDCDSTVGLPGKPMDDALALLYLLVGQQKNLLICAPRSPGCPGCTPRVCSVILPPPIAPI